MTKRRVQWLILGGVGGLLVITLGLVISRGRTVIDYLCSRRDTIATLDVHNQRRIIFTADVCFENDSRPIYYQVWESGRMVTPTTFVHNDDGAARHTFATFYAEGGSLVAVLDTTVGVPELVVMEDFAAGESWPRLRDNEVATDKVVKQKWQRIFERLQRENPQLRKPDSLDR